MKETYIIKVCMWGKFGGGPKNPWYQRLQKKSTRQRQMERSLDSVQGPKRAVMPLVVVCGVNYNSG